MRRAAIILLLGALYSLYGAVGRMKGTNDEDRMART